MELKKKKEKNIELLEAKIEKKNIQLKKLKKH